MVKGNYLLLLLPLLVITSAGAKTLYFNDNASMTIEASANDINRIFVKGDDITQHIAPRGTFIFDRHRSKDGSLYFKPVYLTTRFSLFLATANGHHFSVMVMPVQGQGKTIEMIPNNMTRRDSRWEKNSAYLQRLQTVMLAMIRHHSVKGMQTQVVTHAKTFAQSKHLRMRLITMYSGGALDGLVYRLTNTSPYPYRLYERKFYRRGVRAVYLSDCVIRPHHSTTVYTLVSR